MKDQVRKVILEEMAAVMKSPGALHVKFAMIAMCIEYLGSCTDRQHSNATGRSEKRFNLAITKLFPQRYHHFTKPDSIPNLFLDFRCPMIHQFTPGKAIVLTNLAEAETAGFKHLTYNTEGCLVLVAEDFFVDLTKAAEKLTKIT
jgi:hypothetical protein